MKMHDHKTAAWLFGVALVAAMAAADEPAPKRSHRPPVDQAGAAAAPAAGDVQTKWVAPELPALEEDAAVLVGSRGTPPAPSPAVVPSSAKAKSAPSATNPSAGAVAEAPSLIASLRLIEASDGYARVALEGGERVLKPGDTLGADTVRSVSEGLIVLDRSAVPGAKGGPATVVLRFGADGRAAPRIFYEKDPTPAEMPRVR